jgi:hypothetical protein
MTPIGALFAFALVSLACATAWAFAKIGAAP